MPGIDAPGARIAICRGVYPLIIRRRRTASVLGVIPGAGVTVALESKDHCLAICHGLIKVHFQVGYLAGSIGKVHPRVIKEVRG